MNILFSILMLMAGCVAHGDLPQNSLERINDSINAITGKTPIQLVRNVYSSTNVTTSAYVQLIASTSSAINAMNIFDSSGQTLVLAVGGSGSEVDQIYITPGGNGAVGLTIPSGSRVSVKAVSGTANSGELDITFLQ